MSKEKISEYKPKVVLTTELAAQIQFLHSQCPKGKEWSGLLIYKVTNGGVDDLANLEIKAVGLFPMDFGEAAFTSFEAGQGWLDCFKQYPEVDPFKPTPGWYLGKIHSHNTMGVFHSATDIADLHNTAPNLPMFLSIVVNYACEVDTELAIAMEIEETIMTRVKWKLKGWVEGKKDIKIKKETPTTIYRMKCENYYEQEDWLIDEVDKVARKKKAPVQTMIVHDSKPRSDWNPKKPQNISQPHVYKPMFENLVSLLTLGAGNQRTAFAALGDINMAVKHAERDQYKKAFKMYFTDEWKKDTYLNKSILVSEITEAIKQFLSHHPNMWITPVIEEAADELKSEYYKLQQI